MAWRVSQESKGGHWGGRSWKLMALKMSEEAIEAPDEQPEFSLRQEQLGGFMWFSGGRLDETR